MTVSFFLSAPSFSSSSSVLLLGVLYTHHLVSGKETLESLTTLSGSRCVCTAWAFLADGYAAPAWRSQLRPFFEKPLVMALRIFPHLMPF